MKEIRGPLYGLVGRESGEASLVAAIIERAILDALSNYRWCSEQKRKAIERNRKTAIKFIFSDDLQPMLQHISDSPELLTKRIRRLVYEALGKAQTRQDRDGD